MTLLQKLENSKVWTFQNNELSPVLIKEISDMDHKH